MYPSFVSDRSVVEPACAKVNLTLHVTGKRPDGYHLLESLVAFSGVHDTVVAEPDDNGLSLRLIGPMADGLAAEPDNSMLQAARGLAALLGRSPDVRLTLIKRLPVSSGIGGGSADAAASLRALIRLWQAKPAPDALDRLLLSLGADVPVCFYGRVVNMGGIGEVLDPAPALPAAGLLLVNPMRPVSTPAIFKARQGGFSNADPLKDKLETAAELAAWLQHRRNDLADPACQLEPSISRVLDALDQLPGVLLSRMSGSGATCFALFASETEACAAATLISREEPDWWVAASRLLGDTADVRPSLDQVDPSIWTTAFNAD